MTSFEGYILDLDDTVYQGKRLSPGARLEAANAGTVRPVQAREAPDAARVTGAVEGALGRGDMERPSGIKRRQST